MSYKMPSMEELDKILNELDEKDIKEIRNEFILDCQKQDRNRL